MVFIPHWFWTPGHACSLFYDFHLLDFKCSDDSEDSEDDLASGWECWLSPIHFNSEVLQESTENLMIGKSMAEFLLHLWLLIEDNTYTQRHPKRGPYPKFPHLNFVNLSFVIGNQSANRAIINWSEDHIYIYLLCTFSFQFCQILYECCQLLMEIGSCFVKLLFIMRKRIVTSIEHMISLCQTITSLFAVCRYCLDASFILFPFKRLFT